MKEWFKKRAALVHDRLASELKIRVSSIIDYKNYLRMDADTFGELLNAITPLIEKNTTIMREQRVLAPLRYLVSGDSYEELKF